MKPENVLVEGDGSEDRPWRLKFCDFGLAERRPLGTETPPAPEGMEIEFEIVGSAGVSLYSISLITPFSSVYGARDKIQRDLLRQ